MENSTDKASAVLELNERIPEGEVVIGECNGLDDSGVPLVSFYLDGAVGPLPATAACAVTNKLVGRQVALLFIGGRVDQPIIVGLLHSPLYQLLDNNEDIDVFPKGSKPAEDKAPGPPDMHQQVAYVDGEKTLIEGKEEIVLRCGEASITLTKAGKIILRGKYLMSRSSGINRILGGAVQIN